MRSLTGVVLSLLALGLVTDGVPDFAWTSTPLAAIGERDAIPSAIGHRGGEAIPGRQASWRSPYAVDPRATGLQTRLASSRAENEDHDDQSRVPQLELRLQQDLSLRSGRFALSELAARAAGMDSPKTRTEKAPAWTVQLRTERKEKTRN